MSNPDQERVERYEALRTELADLDDAAMGGVAAAGFQIDDPDIGGGLGGQGTVHPTSVGTGGGIPKSNR